MDTPEELLPKIEIAELTVNQVCLIIVYCSLFNIDTSVEVILLMTTEAEAFNYLLCGACELE